MLLKLFLLFSIVPLVELVLLVWLTRLTSIWITLGTVVTTGLIGATLARRQGLRVWARVQQELAEGRAPAAALLDGVMILVAGTLLITPGVLTDLCGFALLVPYVRRGLGKLALAYLLRRTTVRFQTFAAQTRSAAGSGEPDGPTIIDAEFTREEPPEADVRPGG